VVPETFQNPPPDLIAEAGHFARMAVSARLGGANFFRPKAAESVGIPTGESMAKAMWAAQNVFENTYRVDITDPAIDRRKEEILTEAMAVLQAAFNIKHDLAPGDITESFWKRFGSEELIDKIVAAGKAGILDAPRAGGWDLKRHVKTHRDVDGIRRYVPGYSPLGVDPQKMVFTQVPVEVHEPPKAKRKEKVVLATVGADAHVGGITLIREALEDAGFEVVFLRGMNLPETVAEVVAETKADVLGMSNLLGLGIDLFPRAGRRLTELNLRDRVTIVAGGRLTEKEEDHAIYEKKIESEGYGFLGVDGFFGPGTDPADFIKWLDERLSAKSEKGAHHHV